MRIVCIGCTHTAHKRVELPEGDVLIHVGDFSSRGSLRETRDFLKWFSKQPHPNKLLVPGNHDICFDPAYNRETAADQWLGDLLEEFGVGKDFKVLINESIVIDGVKFWGSPYTPWFHGDYWAFNLTRGDSIKRLWDSIPEDTDVILTHGPAFSILDRIEEGTNEGCVELALRVEDIKPKLHICSHIHEGYGVEHGEITYINCSQMNRKYRLTNKPLVYEYGIVTKD